MFAAVSAVLLGAFGFYLYLSLQREIAWRDDQALLGRLERMQILLDDSDSIEALRNRPHLYENMLGNHDNLLWIVDHTGKLLIEINPLALPIPMLAASTQATLADINAGEPLRVAWIDVVHPNRRITLIAGKVLHEREQMLSAYRYKLWGALSTGALLAFLLGWLVSQRGLSPVRRLAKQASAVGPQHLDVRLDEFNDLSELKALINALNQMLARLEDGFAQLSRFSEDLAHEMRTPLTNLMGQTQQVLGRNRPLEDYQNLLVSNLEEYERLARMIDSMLFLARSEQPKASLTREVIDLGELTSQLCDYFEGMAQERGNTLINEASGKLLVDAQFLRRALANLVANALRYGASNMPVTIRSVVGTSGIEISVHNHGEPISNEHLPHLFERFYRCDPSRNQPDDSGGLGLAIVRSIMHAHGGQALVSSNESGTRFTLQFPL